MGMRARPDAHRRLPPRQPAAEPGDFPWSYPPTLPVAAARLPLAALREGEQ